MKKNLSLVLLTISCLIQAQDTKNPNTSATPAQATITANPVTSNTPYLYPQYPVALDLHDTVFKRKYSIVTDTMLKEATWSDLGCFLYGVICYGIETKILRRKTLHIENYLLPDLALNTTTTLTPAQIAANQAYADRVVRMISCFEPMNGAADFLQTIKDQGHPMFAFSNIASGSYELLTRKYPEIMRKFDGRVIIENSKIPDKSEPAAYQRCLDIVTKTTGTKPEKVIFYDDSPKKLDLAKQFKATKITIDRDGKSITTTEPESRFIPVLCQSGSPAQITTSRALLLNTLATVKAHAEYNPDKLQTID
jgi:FMN phosphatase YigB (HAD superfamily)